jgi:DNA-binding NarL/FixJ family response regulator
MGTTAAPSRVLLGNLEPMVRIGMRRMLTTRGIEVVAEEQQPADIVGAAQRLLPDAVVLDMDHDASREVGEDVRRIAPGVKVIFWARDELLMEVLDPGAAVPRRLLGAVPDGLRDELSHTQGTPLEE